MSIERHKEIRRRRHRKQKLAHLKKRAGKSSTSEKSVIAAKLRLLTPGADVLIANWGLGDR